MKKLLCLVLVSFLSLGLVACGSSGNDTPKETAMTKDEINRKLYDISNWLIGDYWNEAVCDIVWYTESGTSAIGAEMDPEITMNKYQTEYAKIADYNTFIAGLSEEDYKDVKFTWEKMFMLMINIDAYIQANGIIANAETPLNADLFKQAMNAFNEAVNIVNGVE